jgi:hypothetical protein
MEAEALPEAAPSLGREILAGFAGAGIAIACLLPIPIVHLVAMPLGPFFGGFVAGNIARPGVRGRAIIAVVVGSGVSGVLALAAAVFLSIAQKDELPSWFPARDTLAAIIAAVWFYEAVMSTIGATVAVALSRKKRGASDE